MSIVDIIDFEEASTPKSHKLHEWCRDKASISVSSCYATIIIPLRKAVCFVCHNEISRTMCPLVACLVPSESPRRGRVHGLGFVAFGPTMGKLLNFKVLLMSYKN